MMAISLNKLYVQVLKEGMKIRVVKDKYPDMMIETYHESGWWIFKSRSAHTTRYVFRNNTIINLDVVIE